MSDLLAARWLMAISLAFHILFAVAGMAMPLFLMLAEILRLRTGDPMWKELALRWARGTAVLFAVGAVSGTVLSFELGLLWSGFTSMAGPAIGIPFTLEGFAFFFEAIFLGVYLYGRERISPWMRVFSAGAIALSGLASGVFVMAVNAWMQSPPLPYPGGDGSVDPWTAFKSPAYPHQAIHMALAAYLSVAFLAAGVHAWALLRRPASDFHRKALTLVLAIAIPLAPLQAVSGDLSAKFVAHDQPVKFAAMEALEETQARAPIRIGPLAIPGVLSWLAHGDVEAEVAGLAEVPEGERPNVPLTRYAFDVMVVCGGVLVALAGLGAFLWVRRRRAPGHRAYLRALVLASPLGLLAVEAGWIVAEAGRQPWVVDGLLRTEDAGPANEGVALWLVLFTALYVALGVVVLLLLRRHVFAELREVG